MQELIFWCAVIIGTSAILLVLPWTKEIFRPLYGEMLKMLVFIVNECLLWTWYFIKIIIRSHFELFDNFIHRKSDYDALAMLKRLKKDKIKERRG
jgi:hypothetical protein